MKILPFTECVDLVGSACQPFEGEKKYVSTGAVDTDHIDYTDVEIIDYHNKPSRANLEVAAGDVLFAKMQGTKKTLLIDTSLASNIYSTGFCAVRARTNVLTEKCLYHLLTSDMFLAQKDKNCSGATQKAITNAGLSKIVLQVPDINMQDAIAALLDQIASIITKRQRELVAFDDLIKARFVEMFGDPVANPKGWPMPLIEDVVSKEKNALKAGPFGSALKKEYYVESGYKIYGQEQVISGDPNYGDYYIDEERYRQLENCAVQAGDVLISLVGTYGKLLIMPDYFEPGIINPRLMKITFDKNKVNPYYFQHYFQSDSLKRSLADNTHGGTMDILNLGIVRKLNMPLPPIVLQNEFVAFVAQVDKSKVA